MRIYARQTHLDLRNGAKKKAFVSNCAETTHRLRQTRPNSHGATPSERQRQDICGIPINLCMEFDRHSINYGAMVECFVQHRAPNATRISTLVPSDAEIVTIITTTADTFVLFPTDSASNLCMVWPSFSARHVLGTNTVVHGWLYRDRRERTHVTVFDASRVGGVDVRKLAPLARHVAVHEQLHQQSREQAIHYHWCGHEAQCMRPFHHYKLDFDVACITRLLEDMDAPAAQVQRVLPCLLVGEQDLRPRLR